MNSKRTMVSAVLMAVLIVATMALKSFSSGPAVLVEATEPEPARIAVPLANEVDPFTLTLTPSKDTWVNEKSSSANYGADLELTMDTGGGGHGHVREGARVPGRGDEGPDGSGDGVLASRRGLIVVDCTVGDHSV